MVGITIKQRVQSIEPTSTEKERRIGKLILDNPQTAAKMTITEMASMLGVAESTIFKYTRKLGYGGFRDFKADLYSEGMSSMVNPVPQEVSHDLPYVVANKMIDEMIASLQNTKAFINPTALSDAVKYVIEAENVMFFGVGGSSVAAYDAYTKYLQSPVRCSYLFDPYGQAALAASCTERDCAILFSFSGKSKATIEVASMLKEVGCKTICITSQPHSLLAEMCDTVLQSSLGGTTYYRSDSLVAHIPQLAVAEYLLTAVIYAGYSGKERDSGLMRQFMGRQ